MWKPQLLNTTSGGILSDLNIMLVKYLIYEPPKKLFWIDIKFFQACLHTGHSLHDCALQIQTDVLKSFANFLKVKSEKKITYDYYAISPDSP